MLLKMGEIIARNMLSWLELLINRYYCISLVVYIIKEKIIWLQQHEDSNNVFLQTAVTLYESTLNDILEDLVFRICEYS